MIVSKPHKKVILNLRDPSRVTSVIPTAKVLQHKGVNLVAVPHKLDEYRVLRNLGFDVPTPMETYYEWGGRHPPFAHQRTTAGFLTTNPRSFCLNGMGCIAGDEKVRVSRKGKSYELTLRELHTQFHGMPDKDSWKARSLKGDRFGMQELVDVMAKGVKPTLRITLADGKTFRCTPDHRIARPDGSWTEAGDLRVGDSLVTNGTKESAKGGVVVVLPKPCEIVSIEDGGEVDVYDLSMADPHHNFVVNGVVVHNSGKTLSVLWAFDYLRKIGTVRKMLVLAPLSTLERAWGDEIFRNFPDMNFAVLHGSREKRHKLIEEDFDVYIINHDGIKAKETVELIRSREDIDLLVVDELASFRNAKTERWKALNFLVNGDKKRQVPPIDWVWGLTGTPIPNGPTDAWAQIKLINPSRVAPYFGHFRDSVMKQVTQFKWAPRDGALDIVHSSMQPAIRFAREDCIDLPPTTYVTRQTTLTPDQKKAFDEMLRKFRTEHDGGEITAVNEAVKLNKLLQICCLKYDTEVLTGRGWVQIQHVRPDDTVWDGVEWVNHSGSLLMGFKPVVDCGGVFMTSDHQVLSESGWVTAKEFNDGYASGRFNWAAVRAPDGSISGRYLGRAEQESAVDVSLCVRHGGDKREPVPSHQAQNNPSKLRVSPRQRHTYDVEDTPIPHMDGHACAVRQPGQQGLGSLRGSGHKSLLAMAPVVRHLLVRHGADLRPQENPWSHRQQRRLRAGELPLGDPHTAGQQQTKHQVSGHPEGADAVHRSCGHLWAQDRNTGSSFGPVSVATGESAHHTHVYDIVNCGPRNRFVVRNARGELRVVHNCGTAYGAGGVEVHLPATPRVELVREIIEEAEAKVIVFVPLTAPLLALAEELRKDFTVEVVHGETSKGARDEVFRKFQQTAEPRVLVANPGTLSHGLTLTAANTIVWFAPIHSNEIYQQACARVTRPGQRLNTLIVNIEATPLERKIYDRLQGREKMQGVLLDLIRDS